MHNRKSIPVLFTFEHQKQRRENYPHDLRHHNGPPDPVDTPVKRKQQHRCHLKHKGTQKRNQGRSQPIVQGGKKPDPKIANPMNRKLRAKMRNPEIVRVISPSSYPTNSLARGSASSSPEITIVTPKQPIISRLFLSSPLSSP